MKRFIDLQHYTHCLKFHYLFQQLYNAPFFTAWFCTNWLILFYPLYLIVMLIHNKCKSANDIVFDAFSDFKEKGFTFGKYWKMYSVTITSVSHVQIATT